MGKGYDFFLGGWGRQFCNQPLCYSENVPKMAARNLISGDLAGVMDTKDDENFNEDLVDDVTDAGAEFVESWADIYMGKTPENMNEHIPGICDFWFRVPP